MDHSPETPENIEAIKLILEEVASIGYIKNASDGFFWDSCYPWVETNTEINDLYLKALKKYGEINPCPYY